MNARLRNGILWTVGLAPFVTMILYYPLGRAVAHGGAAPLVIGAVVVGVGAADSFLPLPPEDKDA